MNSSPDIDPFYAVYRRYKNYVTPVIRPKHMRRWDRDVWGPAAFRTDMSVLEVGCGTGPFLAYLHAKGVNDFIGVDHDPDLADVVPQAFRDRLVIGDLWDYLSGAATQRRFDRIALFDVLEHFTYADGLKMLTAMRGMLRDQGRIVLRVPNVSSPWGVAFQFGDLTHRAAYTPESLRQLALACGLAVTACYPHRLGSPVRQVVDRAFHGVLSKLVATPPAIWTANLYAVLEPES